MRAAKPGQAVFALAALLAIGCAEEEPGCALTTTLPDYTPACEAVLVRYSDESRLQLDGVMEAILPADLEPETIYGGRSGNPMTVILNEELAEARTSTLTVGPDTGTVRLDLYFDSGTLSGVVHPVEVTGDE